MKLLYALAAVVAATLSAGASAQTLKPGLWEVTSNVRSGAEAAKGDSQGQQMPSMPPEQRRKMEEMLAKQGMKMDAAGPTGMSVRVCMTKEMIDRNELATQGGDCKHTQQQRSGNTTKMAFTCASPPSAGEGQVTIVSPESYMMKMVISSTGKGNSRTINLEGAGKWLSADCGAVKAMSPTNAK